MRPLPPFTIRNNVFQHIYSTIETNSYVSQCKTNKKKDAHSLSYLIDRELSQSDCIKLGYGIESVMKDYILSNNARLINIKSTNKKGQKEKDHLFKDEITKTIYYAELKSNLNLDTEKCKSTTDKCLFLERELSIENPNYNVKMFLVNNRYFHKDVIPNAIMKKYNRIENNVVGTCDYFEALGVQFPFSHEEEYKSWLNYLADMMFTDNKEII